MRSNLSYWLTLAVVLPAAWALAGSATAKEAAHEFLDKLRERGYGEVTLDYLAYLKQNQLVPDDVAADWDLYESRAWRLAVGEAFNPKEAAERREKAQSQLEKYLKEHPDSALASEEVSEWGTMLLKEGLRLLEQAGVSKDPERKVKLTADARAALDGATTRLKQAVEMAAKQLAAQRASGDGKRPKRGAMTAKQKAVAEAIASAELFWLDAKFKLAKTDFFEAETFADDTTDEGKKHRTDLLRQAASAFYDIYQGYRTTTAGLLAHTWEGKAQAALGDEELAQEIYEEVLVLTPDNTRTKVEPRKRICFAR